MAGLRDRRDGDAAPDAAALTYARRYALFILVGIAGEDDLDAPDLNLKAGAPREDRDSNGGEASRAPIAQADRTASSQERAAATFQPALRVPANEGPTVRASNARKDAVPRPVRALLSADESATLREHLIGDLNRLQSSEDAADWVHKKSCGQKHIDGSRCRQRGGQFSREGLDARSRPCCRRRTKRSRKG
jgi:hypothetical protein